MCALCGADQALRSFARLFLSPASTVRCLNLLNKYKHMVGRIFRFISPSLSESPLNPSVCVGGIIPQTPGCIARFELKMGGKCGLRTPRTSNWSCLRVHADTCVERSRPELCEKARVALSKFGKSTSSQNCNWGYKSSQHICNSHFIQKQFTNAVRVMRHNYTAEKPQHILRWYLFLFWDHIWSGRQPPLECRLCIFNGM